jgi:hypothetical protein
MEASQRHERYKLDNSDNHGEAHVRRVGSTSMVEVDPRLPALYVGADWLVGIDGPREEIVELLMGDDKIAGDRQAKRQPPKVVSILGFGGLGKTTLAMQVYSKIKWQFSCSAFVSVSRNPNAKKILTDMLRQVGSNVDLPTDAKQQLIEHLRLHLGDKRYVYLCLSLSLSLYCVCLYAYVCFYTVSPSSFFYNNSICLYMLLYHCAYIIIFL